MHDFSTICGVFWKVCSCIKMYTSPTVVMVTAPVFWIHLHLQNWCSADTPWNLSDYRRHLDRVAAMKQLPIASPLLPHPLLSSLSSALVCVHVCICVQSRDWSRASVLLFCCSFPRQQPFASAVARPCDGPLWQFNPSFTLISSSLLSPHLLPHSFPPRLFPPHLLPPSAPSQALGRKRTASALQTQGQKLPAGSHGNSFSLTLSPLPRSVKGSVENRRAPLFFSTLSHSPN